MGTVTTVSGEISPGELGYTLTHEHLLLDMTAWIDDDTARPVLEEARLTDPVTFENLWEVRERPYTYDNCRLDDVETAIEEVQRFQEYGGDTIVDVTSIGLHRDPEGLRRIARRTGVNVVAGTGHYVSASHPPDIDGKSAEDIADGIISDLNEGIGGTDVRAGIIGEVGASKGFMSNSNEKKTFRGAAIAQAQTGVPITVHPPYNYEEAHDVLDVLEDAGADLENVVIGHLSDTIRNEESFEYHRSIGERGAYLAFDDFGMIGHRSTSNDLYDDVENVGPLDEDRINRVVDLYKAGFADQLLLSQDMCRKTHLTVYGGNGYGHLLRNVTPRLQRPSPHREALSREDIDRLMIENPRRLLSLSA